MNNKMTQPTEYDLYHIKVTSHTGEVVDLKTLFQELNVYTSLFADSMTASLLLTDANNLPANLPLIGGESVELKYKTAGRQNYKVVNLKVAAVDERHPVRGEALAYWVHLVTPEKYADAGTCVSQSFSGSYTDIVKLIPGMLGSSRAVRANASSGVANFISPMWSPLKIGKFAASRASDSESSPFYFWEDCDGFNFKSLGWMYKQQPSREYFYEPNDQRDDHGEIDMTKKFLNIERMEFGRFDRLALEEAGAFASTIQMFDIRTKTLTPVNSFPAFPTIEDARVPDVGAGSRSKVGFTFTKPDSSHVTTFQRHSSRQFLNAIHIMAVIPGDDELRAGEMVTFRVPSHEPQGGETLKEDQSVAGDWLVVAIKETMSKQQYKLSVQFAKDSYSKSPI